MLKSIVSKTNLSPGRLYQVDLARGIACLSMPIFHTVYNLYSLGLIDTNLTRATFWIIYQKMGLSTFVFVSGISFVLSTQQGINWHRLGRRIAKLGAIAALISIVTWLVLPNTFVRFGVLHFFTISLLLAPLFMPLKYFTAVPGLAILTVFFIVGKPGLISNIALYPTGLMSNRPSSIDYIPLIPWFGVFLLGMSAGRLGLGKAARSSPKTWMVPIIWLGQHSLPFYIVHQIVVYGVLSAIAFIVN